MLSVAIIGRPNVGKSTLFNRLVGKKLAIVHDQPGVTRDRKMAQAKFKDLEFSVIDTAGYEYSTSDNMESRMWKQTQMAIEDADLCLFLYDARAGLQPYDELFADLVRKTHKPVVLLANKCEGRMQEDSVFEAYKLGFGEPIPFSAVHGIGFEDLYLVLSRAIEEEKEKAQQDEADTNEAKPIKVAFVGRPNVGKSTLVNALLGSERMLTGPEAGMTRDAITSKWQWENQDFELVDTAGLRRQGKVTDSLEKLSVENTIYAANMAQVVVLVLDSAAVLDKQDLTIARKVLEEGRALVIAVNKWDIAERKEALEKLNYKLETSLTQAAGVPTVTISALKKQGLDKLMRAIVKVYKRWNMRIPTAPLNQWFADVQEQNPAPMGKNKRRIKLKYITQAKIRPPSFFIFSSNPEGLPESYFRYLVNSLRDTFDLGGIPLRITVRKAHNPYADKK
ncbi:MAG: ribosome biogenesis GTPase Der [Alphaproteobacteria bacterium]|nr:ribosome biogenesis GTPase Der [Alphaproteobacteria bacterium]